MRKTMMICGASCLMLSALPSYAEKNPIPNQDLLVEKDGAFSLQKKKLRCNLVPPVTVLRILYKVDPNFRTQMTLALEAVQPLYGDDPNPWVDKSFRDFTRFFREWYELLPVNGGESPPGAFPPGNEVDEFEYVTMFGGFYYLNQPAQSMVTYPGTFRTWSRYFTTCRGKFMDSPESTETLPLWENDPSIKMDEYIKPLGGYQSFNEFFIRDLKPGFRPIASPGDDSVMVAPTDCVLNMIQPLTPESEIPTKGEQKLTVSQLLDNSPYAQYFQKEGSIAISCILLPNTYHHYHAVVSGLVVESKEDIKGAYWGIKDFLSFFNDGNVGYGQDYSVFENFRRGYFVIQTEKYGYVAMVAVGLDTIGSVVFEDNLKEVTSENSVSVYKGDKMGHFAYGGSMVITLVEQGITSITIPQGAQIGVFASEVPPETPYKK
jgi:phosphatidylserine decarboxylase